MDAVHEAAIADNFPHFSNFRMANTRGSAFHWTWASALRTIYKMKNRIVMMMFDDYYPIFGYTFPRLEGLIAEIIREDNQFRLLQLTSEGKKQHTRPEYQPYTSMLQKGLGGENENALILNNAGAQLLLDAHIEKPFQPPPENIGEIARKGITEGLYHTLEPVMDVGFEWRSDLLNNDEYITKKYTSE